MAQLTWDQLIKRLKVDRHAAFGDLQIETERCEYRGPLKEVYFFQEGVHFVNFETIWTACRLDTGWYSISLTEIAVGTVCRLFMDSEGTVRIEGFGMGSASVTKACLLGAYHPSNRLDPTLVHGLTGHQLRQSRAKMYGLPLNCTWSQIVERVVHDLGGAGLADSAEQARIQQEAARNAA
jgi:hypothetical protein